MALTEIQAKQLSIWPHFTSILSIMGSSAIIFEILSKKEKRSQVMFRLLLAMSISDVSASCWYFLSTWPIPKENVNLYQANGTDASCTAQGFFIQLSILTPIYNFALSIYYLLFIRYRFDEGDLAKIEKWFHFFPWLLALITSFASLGLDLFNNSNLWCWIAPYPLSCKGSYRNDGVNDCIRGNNAWIYRWAFFYAPLWTAIFFSMIAMFLTYDAVRKQEKKVNRYEFASSKGTQAVSKISAEASEVEKDESDQTGKPTESAEEIQENRKTGTDNKDKENKEAKGKGIKEKFKKKKDNENMTKNESPSASQHAYSKRVARQALWYLGAFYLSWTPATLTRLIQTIWGVTFYPLILLMAIFLPMQGFFNYIVYIRPRFIANRSAHLDKSFLQVAWMSIRVRH